jgi:hexosaminidase
MMNLNLIPMPASIRFMEGAFHCAGLPKIDGDSWVKAETAVFCGQLRTVFPREDPGVRITLKRMPRAEKREYYKLTILPEGITVEAADGAGAYHGLQTLRQLFMTLDAAGLPCAVIEDYPQFPWRGLMLDCSRNFFTVEFIKKLIDVLSLHHLSKFHWHLSDDQGWRLPVEKYPLLTEIGSKRRDSRLINDVYRGGFYTAAEIEGLIAWAAARHVEVVPEIDLPGHTSSVLAAYPGLGCTGGPYRVEERFGVFDDILCAGNGGLWDLAAAVFDTLASLFPSTYVHIGGDEVSFRHWAECPKCRAKMEEWGVQNVSGLQPRITAGLAAMLAERGKTPIGWDEVIDNEEESKKLPQDLVIMSWRGRAGGDRAVKMGRPVIMTPNSDGCYFDYKQKDSPEEPGQPYPKPFSLLYGFSPVSAGMTQEESARVLGGQGNLWTEYIYASKIAEYMIFPRLCALAEALWTPRENKNFEAFSRRLAVHNRRLESLDILYCRH